MFEKRLNFLQETFILVIFFATLLFIFPLNPFEIDVSNLITATTVLFAIIAGFFIASAMTNYFKLQSLIAEETGGLASLYSLTKSIDKNIASKLSDTIDSYLINAFDPELTDYIDKTWGEFNSIINVLDEIKPKDEKDAVILDAITEEKTNLFKIRQEISLVARTIIDPINWITLISLAIITIFLLYSLRESNLASSIFTVLLSIAVCFILLLLRDIDTNRFAEKKLAFEAFEMVFPNIGKLKYYPEISIRKKRISPPKDEDYRLGIYTDWPHSFKKEIKIITAKKF